MSVVFEKTTGLTEQPMHYCPGCTHGIIHRLVAETLVEMDILGRTVGIVPVGCAVMAYDYFNCDMIEAAHGRAPAVATGVRRALPNATVFTYQGDGDLAAIGTGETVHAATRGENITIVFVNNAIYGMTGGQMAPTTLPNQKTQTTPLGRDVKVTGFPIRMSEMLATIEGVAFVERVAVNNPKNIRRAKKSIQTAFQVQQERKGFSMVEVLSTCPTNWGMTPVESLSWIDSEMVKTFPLGIFKDRSENGVFG